MMYIMSNKKVVRDVVSRDKRIA